MDRGLGELHGRGLHPQGDAVYGRDKHPLHQGHQEQVHGRSSGVWLHKLHQRPGGAHLHAQTQRQDDPWDTAPCQVSGRILL